MPSPSWNQSRKIVPDMMAWWMECDERQKSKQARESHGADTTKKRPRFDPAVMELTNCRQSTWRSQSGNNNPWSWWADINWQRSGL